MSDQKDVHDAQQEMQDAFGRTSDERDGAKASVGDAARKIKELLRSRKDNDGLLKKALDILDCRCGSSVEFWSQHLGSVECKVIAEALKHKSSVTHLNLSNNGIGDDEAKAIAEALKHSTSVTHLNLSGNIIGPEGGKVIGAVLRHNTSVTHLYLSHNEIHDYGAKALAEALKDNASVTHLTLKSNNIGDEGGKALLSCLKVNMTIKQLHCFSATLSKSSAFAHLLATTHHKRPGVNVSFSR